MKNTFAVGLDELVQMQWRLVSPPRREEVSGLVDELVKTAGLGGDPRENYFRLLATCALRNQEARFRNWRNPKKVRIAG